jgi:hypothetical protein
MLNAERRRSFPRSLARRREAAKGAKGAEEKRHIISVRSLPSFTLSVGFSAAR